MFVSKGEGENSAAQVLLVAAWRGAFGKELQTAEMAHWTAMTPLDVRPASFFKGNKNKRENRVLFGGK
jgi:hypothetical protein